MKHQIRHLKRRDRKLAKVIEKINLEPLMKTNNHFRHLVESIISQQLSVKAADTITTRFIKLFAKKKIAKFPTPKDILKTRKNVLRSAGISGQKASYIRNIARAKIDFKKIKQMGDEEVIVELTKIKGIGRWTAEMFLMFSLQRDDVFSCGDLGLLNGMKKVYGLRKHPSRRQVEKITAKWKPYRTLAARYLWASLDNNG
ncbi:MAG: hypothetical protein A3B23_00755 [Candidatus Colwellbacteria bacterium RIFCSPLOWO2_01_FULL_48_10]|uniref:DNA-3-methyladenine glycosylase II n=2 Tax=Bacteria candidate phyla TaxID=1783234 RepID=A0A1F5NYZ9_9BACT|nr:MAG: hypothetical protein A2846_03395 [Candidatus Doudnabacteria bacterium RIFCSPHIGHO2_01_FULL_49_9]OGY59714.1 MAG: hypothetical protein A3B23_00755 [Candidatus Colwellbacteria bacterium RIFCSPLOWO2_01_FULL_48_10]